MKRKQFEKCRFWKTEHFFDYYKIIFNYSGIWQEEHNDLKNRILEKREELLNRCTKECVEIIEKEINNPDLDPGLKDDYKSIPQESEIDGVIFRSGLEYFAVELRIFAGYWTPKFMFDSKTFVMLDRVK